MCHRYPKDSKDGCVGESFKSCDVEDPNSLCVGRAFRAYFYEFNKQQNTSTYPGVAGGGYGMHGLCNLKNNQTTLCIFLLKCFNAEPTFSVPFAFSAETMNDFLFITKHIFNMLFGN